MHNLNSDLTIEELLYDNLLHIYRTLHQIPYYKLKGLSPETVRDLSKVVRWRYEDKSLPENWNPYELCKLMRDLSQSIEGDSIEEISLSVRTNRVLEIIEGDSVFH